MIGNGRVMDVKMRKVIDIQKKKKRIQLGNIQNKRQTNDYTERRRRSEKRNKTNLGDSGDYNYRILSSSFCQGKILYLA